MKLPAVLLMAAAGLCAQPCHIQVTVIGKDGAPMKHAKLVVESLISPERPRAVAFGSTDSRGEALFVGLMKSRFRVSTAGADPVLVGCEQIENAVTLRFGVPAPKPATPPPTNLPKRIVNSVGIAMVLIPAGTVHIGRDLNCPKDDPFTAANEYRDCVERSGAPEEDRLSYDVTIPKPFYMSETEITQEQYVAVMGRNPSRVLSESVPGHDSRKYPVDQPDMDRFIERLNALDNTHSYRLPTEPEWVYAATAGGTARPTVEYLLTHEWVAENSVNQGRDPRTNQMHSENMPHPVGLKPPNSWGLYDMWGNLPEVCAEGYKRWTFVGGNFNLPAAKIVQSRKPVPSMTSLAGIRLVKEIEK